MPAAPVSMFYACLDSGLLTTEPEASDVGGGFILYTARCELTFGKTIDVSFLPLAGGVALPYALGDNVCVVHNHGTGFVLGIFESAIVHDGHTQLSPRGAKDVRLGPVEGGAWEALMLYTTASGDLIALKARVDYVAAGVTAAMNAASPGSGTPFQEGYDALGDVTGGDAAAQAKGRKAS